MEECESMSEGVKMGEELRLGVKTGVELSGRSMEVAENLRSAE